MIIQRLQVHPVIHSEGKSVSILPVYWNQFQSFRLHHATHHCYYHRPAPIFVLLLVLTIIHSNTYKSSLNRESLGTFITWMMLHKVDMWGHSLLSRSWISSLSSSLTRLKCKLLIKVQTPDGLDNSTRPAGDPQHATNVIPQQKNKKQSKPWDWGPSCTYSHYAALVSIAILSKHFLN